MFKILCPKPTLTLLLVLTMLSTGFARKIYFSTSGNDSYTLTQAQNPATPWKTLVRLQNFAAGYYSTGVFPNKAAAGDTFLFKRGDVFANGADDYGSMKWWGGGYGYGSGYNCPSGTPSNPIVFTFFGDNSLAAPNLLFPYPANTISKYRHVLCFANVSNIVIDGLMFKDTRFPVNDKRTSAYCADGLQLGQVGSDAEGVPGQVSFFTVKNCTFSNIGYGIESYGSNIQILNNHFSNFKSNGDTIGQNDIGADALLPSGKKYLIKNNYISGSWAYANPNSSSGGMLGGGLESINDFDSSLIIHNIFIDNSGAMEFGQNRGTQFGPNDDTFAYNLFINNGKVIYVNTGGSGFSCSAARIKFWNNVIIENNKCRFSGAGFGGDAMGDGQTFATTGFRMWPQYPVNPSFDNYGGYRTWQYTSDVIYGSPDTLLDIRNNVIWITTGTQANYSGRSKIFYRNNMYRITGGHTYPSAIGAPLGQGERLSVNGRIFMDTSSIYPQNWNLNLLDTSSAINAGLPLNLPFPDYGGNNVVGLPDIGVFEKISGSSAVLNATATSGSISCNGGTTSVTVSATGGSAPYSGTGTFTVSAGSHTYIVTDASGNRDTVTLTVNQPTAIVVTVSSGTITVTGGTTSVQVNATGGTGSYTYSLNGGAYQSSNIFSNVAAGSHAVNVRDANGCIMNKSFVIDPPATTALSATATAGTIACFGGTTTVTVSASGGTPPYTGTGTFTVSAGTHSYTITDAGGQSRSASVTVGQPTQLTLSLASGTIAVFGGTTSITCTASGGTGTRSFRLNTGAYQSSGTFSSVPAGTHNVTVRDANNCTESQSITIGQPSSSLTSSVSAGTIACNGGSTTVTVTGAGGTPPYTGTGTFSVTAGNYSYTVTDANGVTSTSSISVPEPSSLVVSATAGTISTNGGTTDITVNASGGTAPFTYSLNNAGYQSSNVFSGVAAGTYSILVKDNRGCIASANITISQPAPNTLRITATPGSISCFGGSTLVNVTATGGTAPYTGTGLFTAYAGTSTYTVRDANGFSQSTTVSITQPTQIQMNINVANDIYVVGGTTSVTVVANGGTGVYTYSLNGGPSQTSNIFPAVGAGNHTMTVVDANSCAQVNSFSVNLMETTGLSLTLLSKTNATCKGAANGTMEVKALGGRAPYQYKLGSNGRYGTNNIFTGLKGGIYRVFAMDANNNVASLVVVIEDGKRRCGSTNRTAPGIHLVAYPNPSATYFTLAIDSESDEDVAIEAMDMNGRKVFRTQGAFDRTYQLGHQFRPGVYVIRVQQGAQISTLQVVKQ